VAKVSDAAEFRKQAEECRQFAETTRNSNDRKFWLSLVRDWLKLAQVADDYKKKRIRQHSENSS